MKAGDISIDLSLDDKNFTVSVKNAGPLLRQLQDAMDKTATSVDKVEKNLNSLGREFREGVLLMASLRFAALDFYDVFLKLPASIMKTAGEIERMTKLMQGLSNESDKVKDALASRNFVFGLAQTAPFEIKSITDSFIKLKSAGIDPTNGSLQSLIDSVAKFGGDSDTLHRASIAIQQMAGKGVISMEELRQQLGEAVPNAMQMMALGVGKSMMELTKSVSKGEVESRSALERMFAVMHELNYGAAQNMMDTWVGLIEVLKTKWELFKFNIAGGDSKEGMFASAKEQLRDLLGMFDGESFRNLGADLSYAFTEGAKALTALVHTAVEFYDEIKTGGEILLAYWLSGRLVSAFDIANASFGKMVSAYQTGTVEFIAAEKERERALQREAQVAIVAAEERIEAMRTEQAYETSRFARSNELYDRYAATIIEKEKQIQVARAYGVASLEASAQSAIRAAQYEMEAVKKAGIEHFASAQKIGDEILATEKLIVQKRALETATIAVSDATVMFKGALGALGFVFNALGGWVTVATLAITGLVALFTKAATEADRLSEASKRAFQGMTTLKEYQEVSQKMRDLQAQRSLIDPNNILELDDIDQQIARLKTIQSKMFENVQGNTINDALAVAKSEFDKWEKTVTKSYSDAIDRASIEFEKKKQVLSNSLSGAALEKALAAEQTKFTDAIKQQGADRSRAIISYYDGVISNLTLRSEKLNGIAKDVVKKEIDEAKKRRDEAQRALEQNAVIGTPNAMAKGKESLNKNPLDGWLTQEKARLDAVTAFFKNVSEQVDGIQAIKNEVDAKVQALIDGGKLKHMKDGKVVDESGRIQDIEELKREMAQRIAGENAEKLYNELQKKLESSGAAVKTSRESIDADGAAVGSELNQTRKWLAALEDAAKRNGGLEFLNQQLAGTGKSYAEFKRQIVGNAAEVDADKFVAPLIQKTKDINSALIEGNRERLEQQYRDMVAHEEKKFKLLQDAALKEAGNDKAALDAAQKRQEDFDEWKNSQAKKHQRDMETPLERLGRQWADTTKQMQDASARWAQGTIEAFVQMSKTGKLRFGDLVDSILTDILRMRTQQTLGGAINTALDKGSTWLADMMKNTMPGGIDAGSATAAKDAGNAMEKVAKSGQDVTGVFGGLFNSAGNVVSSIGDWIFGTTRKIATDTIATTSMNTLSTAAFSAAGALNMMAASSGGSGGILGSIGKLFQFGAGDTLPSDQTYADMDWIASANGNIVGPFGAMALNKYASGGIARSPQLSIFGEGDMPEAYVPLPDGRSIPVTMAGGGAPNVTVNLVNQSGQAVNASQAGARFDGKQLILDVVLTAMNTPGPFRDAMKGAVR